MTDGKRKSGEGVTQAEGESGAGAKPAETVQVCSGRQQCSAAHATDAWRDAGSVSRGEQKGRIDPPSWQISLS